MNPKILVVDDERDICEILEFNLVNEGYEVTCAHSAEEALKILAPDTDNHRYALILLDVMMGGMSGYKLAETLRRADNQTPIIFLTAKDTENDMLTGFSVGADDYISKPFSIKEVAARVRSVIRRGAAAAAPKTEEFMPLVFDNLSIDIGLKEVRVSGEPVELTRTEFEILALLASHPDRLFRREDIIDTVWAENTFITERTVDVHIARLRKKLGDAAAFISNRSGFGYRFQS